MTDQNTMQLAKLVLESAANGQSRDRTKCSSKEIKLDVLFAAGSKMSPSSSFGFVPVL